MPVAPKSASQNSLKIATHSTNPNHIQHTPKNQIQAAKKPSRKRTKKSLNGRKNFF
jgi:hypothetical protein